MAVRLPQLATTFSQILAIYHLETNVQWFGFHWLYGDTGNRKYHRDLNKNLFRAAPIVAQALSHATIFGRAGFKSEGSLTGDGV